MNNVQQYHICKILSEYTKLDTEECKDYYGAFRSATDHGLKDILDRAEMQNAETKAERLDRYTSSLIREYVERKKNK